jgi:preprotein translocase subunit SecD
MLRCVAFAMGLSTLHACSKPPVDPALRGPQTANLIDLRLAQEEPAPDFDRHEYQGRVLYVARRATITDADLHAVRSRVRGDRLLLNLYLLPDGTQRLHRITGENVGKRLIFLLDGRMRGDPVIQSAVAANPDLALTTAVDLPAGEAERIVEAIRRKWPEIRVP